MNASLINTCSHARKALMRAPTTNYPPPSIVCLDCQATVMTIEEAKRFVEAAASDGGER